MLFQLFRGFYTTTQHRTRQHGTHRNKQAKNKTKHHIQRFFRFHWLRLSDCRVDNPHVTNGTGFRNTQLLLAVK
ncbi:Uncharacterised protein [Shigella flexneri]|nr:Uncharacterised protein [Shigella sonnei]SRN46887.1 Uncharacterised protein [Shigella flexneri]